MDEKTRKTVTKEVFDELLKETIDKVGILDAEYECYKPDLCDKFRELDNGEIEYSPICPEYKVECEDGRYLHIQTYGGVVTSCCYHDQNGNLFCFETDEEPENFNKLSNEIKSLFSKSERDFFFVKEAFNNASKIIMGDSNYQDIMVNQRVEGPQNAGSSYDMTAEEIKETINRTFWEEVKDDPNVTEGCRLFRSYGAFVGLNGIMDIKDIPNYKEQTYYAIDPKGTGKISIGIGNVPKQKKYHTYLIVGPEEINDKTEQVVYTFHPGPPVSPSMVETKDISDGTKLTYKEVEKLGFSKVKYMSPEMVKEYDGKSSEMPPMGNPLASINASNG